MSKDSGISIDPEVVRELANILDDTGLSEIEVEVGEMRIRVVRQAAAAPQVQTFSLPAPQAPHLAAPQPAATAATAATATPAAPAAPTGEVVKSPMVGTAFLQPSPGADPFVIAGSSVKKGQTLMIVEAMKTMNPIPAPRDGVVAEILIDDAQPVEFGEPLVVLE
ncbi:MAG: acetyl-CoA carboxylase biotin carboxyl carrier protein [Caulobacteraceae bacterium]